MSDVSFTGTVVVNETTQVVELTGVNQNIEVNETIQVVEVSASGPQGIPGPTGPAGGTAQLFESSSPPLGAVRGDLWLVTTPLEQP